VYLLRRLYGQFNILTGPVTPLEAASVPATKHLRSVQLNIVTVSVTPLEAVNVPATEALRSVKHCYCVCNPARGGQCACYEGFTVS